MDSPRSRCASTPAAWARSTVKPFMSTPATRYPDACARRQAICPMSPRPITHTRAPGPSSAMRRPCRAMLATVLKAASTSSTPSGTGTASMPDTTWYSPCPAPPVATRWPTRTDSTCSPTSTAIPTAEQPSGIWSSSRFRTASTVVRRPSCCAFFTTCRTRSGRAFAFWRRFFLASSRTARSVPADTTERVVRTRTSVGPIVGTDVSTRASCPVRTDCTSCFIRPLRLPARPWTRPSPSPARRSPGWRATGHPPPRP